jgi:hypothetical protein
MSIFTTANPVKVQSQARPRVKWGQVFLFSSLALGLTYGWHSIKIVPHLSELLAASKTPTDATFIYGNMLYPLAGMFGPMLAAIFMRLFISREGLRGSFGFRQPVRVYLAAVFLPMLFLIAVSLALVLIGKARFSLTEENTTALILPVLGLTLIFEWIVSFGEEYGWRGYLLPRLMPLGEIKATLILGVIWALWHLPVLLTGVLYGGNNLWLVLPMFVFIVTMSAFPYTWLATASRHSSILASMFHGSTNWFVNNLIPFLVVGSLLTVGLAMGIGWLLIALIVYGVFKRSPQVDLESTQLATE